MKMGTDIFISATTKVNLDNDFTRTNFSKTTVKGKRVSEKFLMSLKFERGQCDRLKKDHYKPC